MAELDDDVPTIACTLESLSEVARTGVVSGWRERDEVCGDHHCQKCSRRDAHSVPLPKWKEDKIIAEITQRFVDALVQQRAQRVYLEGPAGDATAERKPN